MHTDTHTRMINGAWHWNSTFFFCMILFFYFFFAKFHFSPTHSNGLERWIMRQMKHSNVNTFTYILVDVSHYIRMRRIKCYAPVQWLFSLFFFLSKKKKPFILIAICSIDFTLYIRNELCRYLANIYALPNAAVY